MRAVLFDLDDTLFDHRYSSRAGLARLQAAHPCLARWPSGEIEQAHSSILEEQHARVVRGEVSVDQARRERFRRLFADAGETLGDEEIADVASQYRDEYLAARRPISGATALLARLKPYARIGVVTNNVVSEQIAKIQHCGLEPFIDVLVASEEAGVAKPDPEIFRLAVERLGCAPEETLMVGDSWEMDILGAQAAGLERIWFNPHNRPCPDASLAVEIRSLEPTESIARLLLGTSDLMLESG